MTTIALIPARGGSKGLPDKNLAQIGGKSLIAHAITVAEAVKKIQEIVVSSDSDPILDEARAHGATPVRRPDELATDISSTEDVIRHHLKERPDISVVVALQPTSPLRLPSDVEQCLDALAAAPTALTVTPLHHPAEWIYQIDEEGLLLPLLGWEQSTSRRQEGRSLFMPNGAVYATRADHLRAGGKLVDEMTRAVLMPRERSVDIDDAVDLALARTLYEAGVGSR